MSRYTDYLARVTADGGVIEDTAACQAAFTAIEAAADFAGLAIGISPNWGVKLSGSDIVKFYNIADNDIDGVVTGTIAHTTGGAHATADFTVATVLFEDVPTNVQGHQACLWKDDTAGILTPVAGAGIGWVDGSARYYAAGGCAHGDGTTDINGQSDTGPADGETSGTWMHTELSQGLILIEGTARKSEGGTTRQSLGSAFDITLSRIFGGGVTVELAEMLFANDWDHPETLAVFANMTARYA